MLWLLLMLRWAKPRVMIALIPQLDKVVSALTNRDWARLMLAVDYQVHPGRDPLKKDLVFEKGKLTPVAKIAIDQRWFN